MTIMLETPRLLLRSFEDADLEDFLAYRSDPLVAEYQGWDAPYPLEDGQRFIAAMHNCLPGGMDTWCQLAIQEKTSGTLLGDIGIFTSGAHTLQAELGFTLARRHQGRGFASEAVRRVITYLFRSLGVHRVTALCDVENTPSYRLMERVGMRREAHYIENTWFKGRWSSEYLYAVLAREWTEHENG